MRFENSVVVVTGGARGIGRATALAFAREGARVVVADVIGVDAADPVDAAPTDVTEAGQVARLFDAVRERYGRLDVLVANAGRPYGGTTLTASDDDWESCLALNLKSAWLCAREAHPLLRASDRASIVAIASAQALRSGRKSFPYSAAKGGLLAMTRSMAVEYAPHVRVNAVIPGQIESVRTESYFAQFTDPAEARRRVLSTFPMRRLGKPEDIAEAVLFLASPAAAWITGTFLTVDGGRDAALVDLSDLEEPRP